MRYMHSVRKLLVLVFLITVSAPAPKAQTFSDAVKQSLSALIVLIGSSPDQRTLQVLGKPETILISDPVPAQGLLNFNARVIHENGISEWSFGTLDNAQIAAYRFAISYVGPVSAIGRNSQILGGDNSFFRKPFGGLFGDTSGNIIAGIGPLGQKNAIAPPEPPAVQLQSPTPPAVDPRVVEFLFATVRQKIDQVSSANISYGGERGPVTYGAASVRIPDDHKIGHIELPWSWQLFGYNISFAPNEHKHFIIKSVVPLTDEAFGQLIKDKNSKTALIFIHGFNVTFEDALYRNAQIVWDLQFKGLSILFTWASRGHVLDYVYDKDSAYLARDAFISLLEKLKREYGVDQIIVLAHSMGNIIAVDGLANYAKTQNPVSIARLVMAAPDVDSDQFKSFEPFVHQIVGGMTLYASSADKAITVSRSLAGGVPRAGDVPGGGMPIVLPNLETIDVTAVGDDIFGLDHDTFAASRDVIEDLGVLITKGAPPPRLLQIHAAPPPPAAPLYWKYVQ
jgi:esterase/lipase superfamily enzyme